MSTPHVTSDQMTHGGKHWTKAELESRAAADALTRRGTVRLSKPVWLSPEARRVWARVRRQAGAIGVLDNLDAEMLAVYCDAVVKYGEISRAIAKSGGDDVGAQTKLLQSWARLIAQYADKLGFSPAARARLAKKQADVIQDGFGDEFD